MWIKESMDEFVKARDNAAIEDNYHARVTFDNILGVMNIACTVHCMKWAACTKIIIEKVIGGCYAGTHEETRKLLNRLSKNKKYIAVVLNRKGEKYDGKFIIKNG
ncbi:MAG: hypothetical protein FWC66_10400 [Oscillospiraceae bacterium]|nr:hypothetical protein [Oscillospiraceae bacterium]